MDYVKRKTSGAKPAPGTVGVVKDSGNTSKNGALQRDLWSAQSCLYLTTELRRLYSLLEFVSPQTQCLPEISLRLINSANPCFYVNLYMAIETDHMWVKLSIIDLDIAS